MRRDDPRGDTGRRCRLHAAESSPTRKRPRPDLRPPASRTGREYVKPPRGGATAHTRRGALVPPARDPQPSAQHLRFPWGTCTRDGMQLVATAKGRRQPKHPSTHSVQAGPPAGRDAEIRRRHLMDLRRVAQRAGINGKDGTGQGSKTTAPGAKSGPLLVFVTKVLLAHGHAHLRPHHLRRLSSWGSGAETSRQRASGLRSQRYLLSGVLQRTLPATWMSLLFVKEKRRARICLRMPRRSRGLVSALGDGAGGLGNRLEKSPRGGEV